MTNRRIFHLFLVLHLQLHVYTFALISLIKSSDLFWHVRELGERDHGFLFKFGFEFTAKFVNHFSSQVVFNSRAVSREFSKYVDPGKQKVVYNLISIDPALLCRKSPMRFKNKGSFKLIIAGTISRKKGQVDAVRAVDKLLNQGKNIELIMMGNCRDQKLLNELNLLIKKSKNEDNFQLVGFLENPYPVMKIADAILVCSQNEAFGRTVLEGMLLGKPVIGTNKGGIKEIIKEGKSGLLYEPGNYMELASKISLLARDVKLRKKISKESYITATQKFNDRNYSGKLLHIFRKVLKSETKTQPLSPLEEWLDREIKKVSYRYCVSGRIWP